MPAHPSAPVHSLPLEVLNLCLSYINSEERCQTIPLVCKSFLQNHLDCPPGRRNWGMTGPGSVTASMVQWLLHVARDACHPGWKCSEDIPGWSRDTQAVCSFIMGNLRGRGGQLLSSLLQFLGGVTQVALVPAAVRGPFRAEAVQRSAGFRTLPVVAFCLEVQNQPLPRQDEADALFEALANVPNLQEVDMYVADGVGGSLSLHRREIAPLFRSLGFMTQIRKLSVSCEDRVAFLDERGMLPKSLTSLVRLEVLDMRSVRVLVASCSPILGLPSLESLQISLQPEEHPAALLLASAKLTRLDITEGSASSAEQYLPTAMPCLRNLKQLALTHMKLETFSESMAGMLKSFTRLDLSHNPIARVPPGLALITTLQYLCMGYNERLQLQPSDSATLAALPDLQTVDLSWGGILCEKPDGTKFSGPSRFHSHPDKALRRCNSKMWIAIAVKHPQLSGLAVWV